MKQQLIISTDSCNGEEVQFENWMNENYPNIETSIENTLNGGYYVDGEYHINNFWDQYCNA